MVVMIRHLGSTLYLLPIMRTAAAAKVEILVTLVQVLEWGQGVAGGGGRGGRGGRGGDLATTTVEEEEECEDAAHFEWEM